MKKILKKTILLLFTTTFIINAQEKLALTLEKSVQLALMKNPEVQIADKEFKKAEAAVWEAYSNILPKLDASVNYQRAWDLQKTKIPNFIKEGLGSAAPPDAPDFLELSFGLPHTLTYGATVTQPLFLGGVGYYGISTSYAAKEAAFQNWEAKKQNLIYQTANAYYACLLTKELVTVQEEALAQAQANLDVVLKKYNVGAASGFDKMRAEVDAANLQPQVISARNNYQQSLTNLRMVLGMEKGKAIEIIGELNYETDEFEGTELEELQKLALANRPEIQSIESQKTIGKNGIALAIGAFLPKVFFQTELSYIAQNEKSEFDFAKDFNKGFTSAISIQIPLFEGFRRVSQYQQARMNYKIMLDTEKQVNDGINAEVEFAFNNFKEANEKYTSAWQTVQLAEEALRLANLMYEEGANTQLDVLNSQLALNQAKLNYISSLYDYQVSRYQLRKVTGQLRGIL